MDEFLEDHIKRNRPDTYVSENNTYGKHLESNLHTAVINRRMYLGQIEESQILFIPKRENRTWKETGIDILPSIVSLWFIGLSVLYTYPRSIKVFRYFFPNTKSFILTHLVQIK
jgi:hypothetical protein